MQLSIRIKKLGNRDFITILYAVLFILYLPTFISRIVDIPYWGAICYIAIFLSDIYFIWRMRTIRKPVILTAVFFGYLLFVTLFVNFDQVFNCLLRTFTAISFAILMEYIFIKYERRRAVSILMFAMEVFNYTNLLFMLLYPSGMYKVITRGIYEEIVKVEAGSVRSASRVLWLLGHQTLLIRFTLPAICIAIVYCCLKNDKFQWNLRSGLLIGVCLWETIIANSAGNYLVLAIYAMILVLFRFRGRIKIQYVYPAIIFAYVILAASSGELPIFTWLSDKMQRSVQISTRLPIWMNTLEAWMQSPIFGWGYIQDGAESIRRFLGLGNPHSSYLWILYEGGIIGLGLFIYYIQFYAGKMKQYWNSTTAKVIYAAFLALLVCMIDDDHIFRSQFYLILFEMAYHIPALAADKYRSKENLQENIK